LAGTPISRHMTRLPAVPVLALLLIASTPFPAADPKRDVLTSIDKQSADLIRLSDQIWGFAETALRESKSSALLASHAEQHGFRVTRGVAGLPTAFTAEFGSGAPIIGIMGEYDALPGISQKVSTSKEPHVAGAPGHGCGHNLFGAASLGAAIAVKEQIASGAIKGTIRFYGTPAEESVGGKVYMARAGAFKDIDVMLVWHPGDETVADVKSSQAIIDFIVEFRGRTAHAAADPWNARSAPDAAEAFTHGVNLLREHVRPSVRMHYTVQRAGDVPNVVADYAKIWMWVRDSKSTGAEAVLERVKQIAQGAAQIAGVESKLTVQAGDYEILVNYTGAKLLHQNMTALGPIQYTQQEVDFAKAIQRSAGTPENGLNGALRPLDPPGLPPDGGSTDVGDVSWLVPTLHFSVTTGAKDAPWHAWPTVATSGMSIGHKGMVHAAKVMAMTAIDLYNDPKKRAEIRAEFAEQTKGFVYKPYIPEGPPPIPPQ
jgi:aminobenzoyl-glutamate utilization protein B